MFDSHSRVHNINVFIAIDRYGAIYTANSSDYTSTVSMSRVRCEWIVIQQGMSEDQLTSFWGAFELTFLTIFLLQ